MKIILPSYEILSIADSDFIMQVLEIAGRTCYKSDDKIKENSAEKFLAGCIKLNHESLVEHMGVVFKIVCDRGVMAELTRHRVGVGFSIQSTRYCNFSKDKFGSEITVIKPCFWEENSKEYRIWTIAMKFIEKLYLWLIRLGAKPEQARSILPNSLATEIIFSANIRALRHICNLRCSNKAHPQIREIFLPILQEMNKRLPALFGDIYNKYFPENDNTDSLY